MAFICGWALSVGGVAVKVASVTVLLSAPTIATALIVVVSVSGIGPVYSVEVALGAEQLLALELARPARTAPFDL